MTIYDSILHRLAAGEAQTLTQFLASLPELAADPHGSDALRLLLRLDRRLRPLGDGRWTLATAPQAPEQRIVASTKAYLDSLPSSGALLDSVVTHVVGETNYDQAIVRSIIQCCFVTKGIVVRNQLKENL
jgi:hypothetical protein